MLDESLLPPIDPVKPIGRLLLKLERERLLEPINEICAREGALIEDVFGERRMTHIVRVRHMVWWWLRDERAWTLRAIGDLFGVDAPAVRYGLKCAGRALGLTEYKGEPKRGGRAA